MADVARIETLKNKQNEVIYPRTHFKAIVNEEGKNLEEVLAGGVGNGNVFVDEGSSEPTEDYVPVNAETLGDKKPDYYANAEGTTQQASVGKDGYIAYPEVTSSFFSTTGMKGRLRIVLPNQFTDTMIKFKISIFDFRSHCSVDYIVSGHLENDDMSWVQVSAVAIGDKLGDNNNLTVYFSHTDTNAIVSIGELNTYWNHPHVRISEVTTGYSNAKYDSWYTGWAIEMVTTDTSTIDEVVDNPWVSASINPNIIFNPNFKINQRGKTRYVEGDTYCVDRWKCNLLTGDNVEVTNNGITLTSADVTKHKAFISQFIEKTLINPGKYTLTFSVDGVVYSSTGILHESGSSFITLNIRGLTCGINYDASKSAYRIYIQCSDTISSFTVNWVKLEPGGCRTTFITPDPTLELRRCQRYFKVLQPARLHGSSYNPTTNVLSFGINDCIGEMRVTPTVKLKGEQASDLNVLDGKVWLQINGNSLDGATKSAGTKYDVVLANKSVVINATVPASVTTLTHPNHTLVFATNTGILCDAEIH